MTEVRLVRLRPGDLDVMARVRKDEAAAMGYPDAFGPAERIELGERIERSGEFDGTELLLGIQVDGRLAGEVQARQPRMGLDIMREHAVAVGASLVVDSAPGRGTTVSLRWPA